MDIGKRIKFLRDSKGLTQEELGKFVGVNKATINRYETGEIDIKRTIAIKLGEALDVSPAIIMGWEDLSPKYKAPIVTEDTVTFPVIGTIAAGYDNIVLEDWSGDTVEVPLSYLKGRNKDDFFVLCVKGDSMFPEYRENDKVLILKQSTMDYSGQVGAVIYDDENATLKKIEYKYGEDWMRLVPINPNHPIKNIKDEALEHCRVLGIPQYLIREIEQ